MADFNSLVSDVYTLTNRPDLVNETAIAVRSATLAAHNSDFYSKDLFETGIAFPTAEYEQYLDYRNVVTNYRSLKYLRKYDAVGETAGDFLEVITPEKILDDYGIVRTDVCYGAGSVIQIKSSTEEQYYLFGCYVHPIIATAATYSSWVADEYPYAIIYAAAAHIFGMLQNNASRDFYLQSALTQVNEMKQANIVIVGS